MWTVFITNILVITGAILLWLSIIGTSLFNRRRVIIIIIIITIIIIIIIINLF